MRRNMVKIMPDFYYLDRWLRQREYPKHRPLATLVPYYVEDWQALASHIRWTELENGLLVPYIRLPEGHEGILAVTYARDLGEVVGGIGPRVDTLRGHGREKPRHMLRVLATLRGHPYEGEEPYRGGIDSYVSSVGVLEYTGKKGSKSVVHFNDARHRLAAILQSA